MPQTMEENTPRARCAGPSLSTSFPLSFGGRGGGSEVIAVKITGSGNPTRELFSSGKFGRDAGSLSFSWEDPDLDETGGAYGEAVGRSLGVSWEEGTES